MPKKFGRELVLLTLPVLLIAGVGFWKSRPVPEPLPPPLPKPATPLAPLRALPLQWKPVWVETLPSGKGFVMAARADGVLVRGNNQPVRASPHRPYWTNFQVLSVRFKRRGQWSSLTPPPGLPLMVMVTHTFAGGYFHREQGAKVTSHLDLGLRVKHKSFPLDAEELQVKGKVDCFLGMEGMAPILSKTFPMMKAPGPGIETATPPPFIITIKGPFRPPAKGQPRRIRSPLQILS